MRGVKERCDKLHEAMLEDRQAGQDGEGKGEGLQALEYKLLMTEDRLDKFLSLQKTKEEDRYKQLKVSLIQCENKKKQEVDKSYIRHKDFSSDFALPNHAQGTPPGF